MSASEFRIPYQPVSSSQPSENTGQFKICRCGEGDLNSQTGETGDSPQTACPNCQVLKSGHLLLSSKGIGWTTWKKRWFILTRASLVFFRSDPNAPPRGNEPVVTLGGIDLNNSGSVVVKEDRKLLTVLFPDGREGRTFTLKAETTEELNEWRNALESALAQAPSVASTVGQNPIFNADGTESSEASTEQSEDKSSVIGRPAQFALIEADGSPAFLEKALRFIEDYGCKGEGILRQSADVEEVKRRFRDYDKGKKEFSPDEDGHVIGDCIKTILREMPASPVPAACCTALVTAYRTDKTKRLDALNKVVYEVFPEPNRQLLQRILKMMMIVGSHKAVNRMSNSALAACMAPLLLRPLLLGECEIDKDFSMAGDGSFQLLQAAAAANHAQAIVIIMLEEYDQIFDDIEEGSSDAYTESDDGDVDKEYSTDNDNHDEDGSYDSGDDDIEEDLDDNTEHSSGGSECDGNSRINAKRDKMKVGKTERGLSREDKGSHASTDHIAKSHSSSSKAKFMKSSSSANRDKKTLWGRTSARKDLDVEGCSDDEALIEKLENNKADLQSKVSKEVKENKNLQTSLEKRKGTLHECRLALEKEVETLRDQLHKERSLRASLESGLMNMRRGQVSLPSSVDSKTKANLEEVAAAEADVLNLKQKACDLRGQLSSQAQLSSISLCESCNKRLQDKLAEEKQNEISSSTEASSAIGANSLSRMLPNAGMADIVEQLRRQAAQNSSSSTGAQRLLRQNSNSLHRLQGPNAFSSNRTEEPGGGPPTALAKLTNRLNFLKERRAMLASEMQNLDLARPPTAAAPNKDST
ncbi:rho GTPase-activating protein REN1-like [Triticum urartu]|uniref:Rho GTPase-activating protein REN1 n=1 Tax=Triticum urartu TaxID=4572 RepID=A0A8R7Q7G0_TRIUA|nr:rho GTPase-activating protein REN1-like [Triticum urartu]XP_048571815.1 rho GTPase-activating protein REN1-like [Triticum urartu]XP_048571816.1 rho GTPase-activating protein REN1-like [Triticum urartu]XP_048571817.1 rho GTPase-activating protein REN1-like [Triticum urartu]XP_048571819.1 rho GTPase-activating protein REN1-like [Triticum urartu]XP_048571820.1 rho GTPase-activating protein REN1-like [Triticum urartu]